jgi:hypothetical protein
VLGVSRQTCAWGRRGRSEAGSVGRRGGQQRGTGAGHAWLGRRYPSYHNHRTNVRESKSPTRP